ncbi:ABC transporter substrate-binding protein [Paenibacillus arenosi]|uniref:ABC transporter substrate-binding protein n=1 Tax=Paenibacillus arenosi TaxID=2774142 RepID=A0ABR9AZ57_9BACL|nr:ABC transporter substrate-binding protein [Paenibacillus arenosi]MBD8499181.1 ABC transporter substrate-binding protein [Paenibacillus arenosi]
MKRKLLSLTALLTLVTVIVTACGGNAPASNNSTTTTTGQAQAGGQLIVAVQEDPRVLNPVYAGDRVTLTINQSLFSHLYTYHNGEKKFVLAESLTPSADNLTYTLKLRKGLTWHDSKPITADDVVFTMDSVLDEKQHSSDRANYIFNGKPLQVKKVDELTVEFKLPQASAAFEGVLASFIPIPKHVFEGEADLEKSKKNEKPIGSGPFKFKEYRAGEYVTLERFDNYFAGKPKLDTVTYRIAKDPNAANMALQNGELQMRKIDAVDHNKLNSTNRFNMVTYPEGRLNYMAYNLNVDVMKKKEVRQAIAYALDRKELITATYLSEEFAKPAASIFTPDTMYHTSEVETYEHNVERAKELLTQAGASNLKLRLAYVNTNKAHETQALYVQQKLGEVGITVELMALDSGAFGNMSLDMNNTAYDLSFGGYIMGHEPDSYKSLYLSDAAYNYSHFKNPEFDALWNQAAVEMDTAKRGELYKQIQQTVANEMTIYPIAYDNAIIAVDKKFGGLQEAGPKPVVMFEDLSKVFIQQ